MGIHNAYSDHIGLATDDVNVSHTRWPCVSHPPTISCQEAVSYLTRRGPRVLTPAPRQVPARDYIPPTNR